MNYRIVDVDDVSHPYALVEDQSGVVVRVDSDPRKLANWAFGIGDCGEVEHDYDLRRAEERSCQR